MVELKPSKIKLTKQNHRPSADEFTKITTDLAIRYIDLIRHGIVDTDDCPCEWSNTDHSVCFEVYQPTMPQLADLVVIITKMHPSKIYSQHADDGHCLVYYLIWNNKGETL